MAWAKLTTKTLTSAGDTITTDTFTTKKFNILMAHVPFVTSDIGLYMTFNSNTNNVYAYRDSADGSADTTTTTNSKLPMSGGTAGTDNADMFAIGYVLNISGQEKLYIGFSVSYGDGSGATNAPHRSERVGKFVPSPDADITSVTLTNIDVGDFATDSNLSVLGTD